jgi:hypothetical protein
MGRCCRQKTRRFRILENDGRWGVSLTSKLVPFLPGSPRVHRDPCDRLIQLSMEFMKLGQMLIERLQPFSEDDVNRVEYPEWPSRPTTLWRSGAAVASHQLCSRSFRFGETCTGWLHVPFSLHFDKSLDEVSDLLLRHKEVEWQWFPQIMHKLNGREEAETQILQ